MQTGDVPLMMEVQADNFVLTYAGRKYSKEQFPRAFEDIWLKVNHIFPQQLGQSCIQDLVDGNTLKNPSLSVTTKVVYEVTTFVIIYHHMESLSNIYICSGRKLHLSLLK